MRHSGFTLLELSIVIVIIGLIVAGISAGQSLVRQAQFRQIFSDIGNIKASFNAFKLQYDSVPGDMANASSYFSSCAADSGHNTCNGDGDGVIELHWGGFLTSETTRAWEHLMLANLWDDAGSAPGSLYYALADVTAPAMPIGSQAAYAFGFHNVGYLPNNYRNMPQNYITLGSYTTSFTSSLGPVFTHAEAFAIDNKLDDGLRYSGKVFTERGNSTTNATTACRGGDVAAYDLDDTTVECSMFIGDL